MYPLIERLAFRASRVRLVRNGFGVFKRYIKSKNSCLQIYKESVKENVVYKNQLNLYSMDGLSKVLYVMPCLNIMNEV